MIPYVKRLFIYSFFTILLPFTSLFLTSYTVHAEEITGHLSESSADSFQNERLNSLEIRLEELGYTINDIQKAIVSIQEELLLNAEQRLFIGQQLDLVIIGLRDLCNYNIELLDKLDLKEISDTAHQDTVVNALMASEISFNQLNDNTVSGNSLIGTFNQSFEKNLKETSEFSMLEFNKTLTRTNQILSYLFVILILTLVIMICFIIGALIHNITKKFVV